PTLDQRIATGFHRNVMVNFEGGADPAEYLSKYIVDRVTTTATVFLGTTLACTECHDHKYDPFTQREFYQLYAYFNNVPEEGLDGRKDNPVPFIRVPTEMQTREGGTLDAKPAQLDAKAAEALAAYPEDKVPRTPQPPLAAPRDFTWIDEGIPAGAMAEGGDDVKGWNLVG